MHGESVLLCLGSRDAATNELQSNNMAGTPTHTYPLTETMNKWDLGQSLDLLTSKSAKAGERNQDYCHHMPSTAMPIESLVEAMQCQCSLSTL